MLEHLEGHGISQASYALELLRALRSRPGYSK
jgi:hypothetical protein